MLTPVPEEHLYPVLTLKNLYRLITQQDYPSPAYPVIPKSSLQGITLVPFWNKLLEEAFPEGTDFSIFDLTQKRSRSLTRLLNRIGNYHFMEAWFLQLSECLSPDLLLRLNQAWAARLTKWHYESELMTERLQKYIEVFSDHDPLASKELTAFFKNLSLTLSARNEKSRGAEAPLLFRHSMVFAWLTLHALFGSRLQDPNLVKLRADRSCSMHALYQRSLGLESIPMPDVLSSGVCTLSAPPLPAEKYVGNQAHLSRAMNLLLSGHHRLAVTGMGGIGKTEFVRQLLASIIAGGLYTHLAYVQYEGGLRPSLAFAFPGPEGETPDACFARIQRLLESRPGESALLLIDNVNPGSAGDPALDDLALLGCDVILSTRLTELDGFTMLPLDSLGPEDSRQLFSLHCLQSDASTDTIDRLCASVSGNPLAISLFADMCRAKPGTLEQLFPESGLQSDYSARPDASDTPLPEMLRHTFSTAGLTEDLQKLLTLFALLPHRFWLPEDMLTLAGDICQDVGQLSVFCQSLHELGWLMAGPDGYAVHPLISETLLSQDVHADLFPALWHALDEKVRSDSPLFLQSALSCLAKIGLFNADAVHCMASLEQNLGFGSFHAVPDSLYQKHRDYLDRTPHTPAEELDYWLGSAIRDVVDGTRTHLMECLAKILDALSSGADPHSRSTIILSVLEQACDQKDLNLIDRIFEAVRPADHGSVEMAEYLAAWSLRLRSGSHETGKAIAALREADAILKQLGLTQTMTQSAVNYRLAFCMLDLGRAEEARSLLESSLAILHATGHPDDGAQMMNTRNTYAVTLLMCQDYENALREYDLLNAIYMKQQRCENLEYAIMRNNTAQVLEKLGRLREAGDVMLSVLELDQRISVPESIQAGHMRNTANILSLLGDNAQALACSEKALDMRTKIFGPESPWTADAQAVHARILFHLDKTRQAEELIDQACRVLQESWGSSHRFTVNALTIQKEIEGHASP